MSRWVIPFESAPALPLLILVTIFLLWCFTCVSAQQNPSTQERPRRAMPTENEPQDVIKIDTDLVPVDVIATDAKGRLVRSLTKDDFKLFEDNVERPIASFNVEKISGELRTVSFVFEIVDSGCRT